MKEAEHKLLPTNGKLNLIAKIFNKTALDKIKAQICVKNAVSLILPCKYSRQTLGIK